MQTRLLKIRSFKETMKKLTWFLPLHPSPFIDKIMENKKGMELVTSLSLSCKTCLEKFICWSDPLNLQLWKGKETSGKYSISQKRKKIFRGNKNHFL